MCVTNRFLILLRRIWSISFVFLLDTFGCMMILLSSCISALFAGSRSSSKVILAAGYIIAVVCILLGLVHPGLDIKLLTKLLVSNFMSFPACASHQLLGTHRSFQVAPPLMSPCFSVV